MTNKIRICIGTVNFHTKVFTEIWLHTFFESFRYFINHYDHGYFNVDPKLEDYCKVVIVNNSPEEDLSSLKQQYSKWVTFIDNETNIGVAPAWNQIIKAGFDNEGNALYDYYIPANNDIYFTKEWFLNFYKGLTGNNDGLAWISSFMNDYKEPDLTGVIETVQLEGRYWSGIRPEADDVDSVEQMLNIIKINYAPFGGIEKFAELLKQKYGTKLKTMHPKAPLFALSKDCLKKVGLFDEYNAPVGLHEDADYCKRIELADLKIGVIFGAYIHHFSMMSRTKGDFKKEDWVEGRERAFQEKWGVSSKEMHKITKDKKFRLDIGSGYGPRKDGHWMHMEIDKKFKDIEYLQDVSQPFPFNNDYFEEVYASNVLEHVSHADVPAVLYEWVRVLKKNGRIEIRVPNMKWICEQYVRGHWVLSFVPGTELNAMHAIFGGDNPGVPHIHKSGFDDKNLTELLKLCGVTDIRNISDPNSWELKIEGFKS